MALVIAATIASISVWTTVDVLLEVPDHVVAVVTVASWVYVALLVAIAARPSRVAHVVALPIGVGLLSLRVLAFWDLWERGIATANNYVERGLMVAAVIVFHTWGVWADRRPVGE